MENLFEVQESKKQLMTKVYAWMTLGLTLTAIIAYFTASNTSLVYSLYTSKIIYVLLLAEVGVVFFLSSRIYKTSVNTAIGLFLTYAALNGVTLASIFLIYSSSSIALTFMLTAGTFGIMTFYGYATKRDLSDWGTIMIMGLVGLVLASIVNIFLNSEMIYWITTYIGVIVFVGLTAYDTQKIKRNFDMVGNDVEMANKFAIYGALHLYLDFINLFLYLLRILGRIRD